MLSGLSEILAPGFRWKLRRELRSMLQQTQQCQQVQARTLQRILRINAGSRFHQDYGLDGLHRLKDFRRALPVADFDRVAPYIEAMKRGQSESLLGPRNQLLMFALTSGTTCSTKFIPVTRRFIADYRRGWQLWGIRAYDDHPRLHFLKIFQIISDWDQYRTPANIPCGNISGIVRKTQNSILQSRYVVPAATSRLGDPRIRFYAALLHGVRSRRVGLVTTANPSTLCQIFRQMEERAEDLVRDLRDGHDSTGWLASLPKKLRPSRNVSRARELDRILSKTGTLRPYDVWPDLQLVAVWTGGSAGAYLPELRQYIGEVPIRDHGLHASEGRMTIPLQDEDSQGVLDIRSHFFEFIPEAEIDSPQPTVLLAHELVEDESYYIVLTTASGLYRYDIRDVVQCTGFMGTTPLLRFLHKGAHISSLTGEKLTESQVIQAVMSASRALSLPALHNFTLAPSWGDPPHYVMLMDDERAPPPQKQKTLADRVEQELQRENLEYQEKRHSGRLAPLEIRLIRSDVWKTFHRHRQSQLGGSIEQYKHPYLMPDLDVISQLQKPNFDSSQSGSVSPAAR